MSEKRSLIAFEHYREGEQRFEYFITGVSTALCAYIGQTLQPQNFGFNSYTLEVLSVGLGCRVDSSQLQTNREWNIPQPIKLRSPSQGRSPRRISISKPQRTTLYQQADRRCNHANTSSGTNSIH